MKISEQLDALRLGNADLADGLDKLCDLIEKQERNICALVSDTYDRHGILAQADRLLRDFPDVDNRPPLFGMPFGVKDIFRVDGFLTRAGSRLPPALFEGAEASAVTRLKAAGAVVMGKTVTTEFACFHPGPTRNPHNPAHTPGGSSSGSAAGVSMGFFPMALGSQTVGSVIRPAAYCGVIGFKPSFGRIPTDGVIPISQTLDHVGFFCSDPSLLSLVAAVLITGWKAGAERPDKGTPVVGIPEGPYLTQSSQNARDHFNTVVDRLRENGLSVVHCKSLADIGAINACHMKIMKAEMARAHVEWYRRFKHLYAPKTAELITQGREIDDGELQALRAQKETNRQQIARKMDHHGIDIWLAPAATDHAPKGLDSTGDPIMNLPWTHAGMPALSIPCGFDNAGLPHGLQLVGRLNEDEQLVGFASASIIKILDGSR